MNLISKLKNLQLHVILLSMAMIVFSLLCWLNFAESVKTSVQYRMNKVENEVVTENTVEEDIVAENNLEEAVVESPVEVIGVEEKELATNRLSTIITAVDGLVDKLDSKWYERMYKKSEFIEADSIITYYMTRDTTSNQVVVGKNRWLFYLTEGDGNTIADYEGTHNFSELEMDDMLEATLYVQNELENRGIRFAMLLAPNKEHIYSEYVPDFYKHTQVSRTDLLVDFLAKGGVKIASPKEELLFYHDDFQLYYSSDSHWNQLGSYIGVKHVLALWDVDMPSVADRTIISKPLRENYHYCASGDLALMTGLRSVYDDDTEYEIEGTSAIDWFTFRAEQNANQISVVENPDAKEEGTLLLIGDSFRSSMVPALSEMYQKVYVVHRSFYSPQMLENINPDYVIAEYVERYADAIADIAEMIE